MWLGLDPGPDPRDSSAGTPVFPFPKKPTFLTSNLIWNSRATGLLVAKQLGPTLYLFIYLFIFRYDVWLVDLRLSCDLPWAVYQDYTLDDCAAYDYPAAIDKVLEITKQVRKTKPILPQMILSTTSVYKEVG